MATVLEVEASIVDLDINYTALIKNEGIDKMESWSRAPLSMPLICLTQLASILNYCDELGLSYDTFIDYLKGRDDENGPCLLFGHSQGTLAAIVLSASSSMQEFVENAKTMLRVTFWMGYFAQKNFDLLVKVRPYSYMQSFD